jgi:anti-sigma factor ChrR (cupin superfamily)
MKASDVLSCDLAALLQLVPDEEALDNLEWRDLGTGLELFKLARQGQASLIMYRVASGAPKDVFAPHRHVGGEAYLVLKGAIADESGKYPAGSLVWLPTDSHHQPWAEGETVVVILWPEGVKVGPAST